MAAENSMMLAERTDELLSRGRSQGFISSEEVADLVQDGDLSAAEVEEFYAALEEEGITVVEGAEEVEAVEPAAAAVVQVSEAPRSEEHTSELQSRQYLVCRLLLEKKNITAHVL